MDYLEGYDWYAQRSRRAAGNFEKAVEYALDLIAKDPAVWPYCDHQRYILRRFPYSIIYRFEVPTLMVVAVAHHSREAEYWQHRD